MDKLPGPQGWPLVGNIGGIDPAHFHQTLENWARQYGPVYRFRLMERRFIATARRSDIAQILHDRPEHWRRTQRLSSMLEEAAARGVFSAEGEEWRRQRKLVMHALTPEVIQRFHPTLTAMTERLRQRWHAASRDARPLDLLRDLKAYALDVTIGMAMGQDQDMLEHEDNPLQRDIEFVFGRVARRLTAPVVYWRAFKLPVDRATDAAGARIRATVDDFIAAARARLAAEPSRREKPANLLEAMLVARDMPGSGIDDEAVKANAIVMVFAGEDTTANSIAWLLYLLAHAPQAAARLAAEVDAVLGEAALAATPAQLERMPYLDACIHEGMRLKPAAPIQGAEAVHDTALEGIEVPAGTVVFMLARHAFALEVPQPDTEQFRPERWLEPEFAGNDAVRKLTAFGGGPRFCPGRYLAMCEIRMVLSMLLRHFTLAPAPGAAVPEELFTVTMTPSALPVLLCPRTL